MVKKKKWIIISLLVVIALAISALDTCLLVQRYTLNNSKVSEAVRIVHLSDLHSCVHDDLVEQVSCYYVTGNHEI